MTRKYHQQLIHYSAPINQVYFEKKAMMRGEEKRGAVGEMLLYLRKKQTEEKIAPLTRRLPYACMQEERISKIPLGQPDLGSATNHAKNEYMPL